MARLSSGYPKTWKCKHHSFHCRRPDMPSIRSSFSFFSCHHSMPLHGFESPQIDWLNVTVWLFQSCWSILWGLKRDSDFFKLFVYKPLSPVCFCFGNLGATKGYFRLKPTRWSFAVQSFSPFDRLGSQSVSPIRKNRTDIWPIVDAVSIVNGCKTVAERRRSNELTIPEKGTSIAQWTKLHRKRSEILSLKDDVIGC
jgi:hypothetical protein